MVLSILSSILVVVIAIASVESVLRFTPDGTFRILQVADLHFQTPTSKCRDVLPFEYEHCRETNSTDFIRRVIEKEKPDLVVYTGDNIDGVCPDAGMGLLSAFEPAETMKTPWAGVLGNHDGQSTWSRHDVAQFMSNTTAFPHSLTQMGPTTIHGYTNYRLQIFPSSAGHDDALFDLVFLDSGSMSLDPSIPGYDWIHMDELDWLRSLDDDDDFPSKEKTATAATSLPKFAFFHIPLIEFETVHKEHMKIVGKRLDEFGTAKINSGAYSAFLEKNVRGVFVGHDHNNDYCGEFYGGIQLCYGGGVGLDTYGNDFFRRRVRTIELQKEGKTAVTWKTIMDERLSTVDHEVLFG